MLLVTSTTTLIQRVITSPGAVTLRLANGADLTGTATVSADQATITITAGTTVWTVPADALLAVAR